MTLTLHHGDCLELMKNLPDKSVDLFLCDLPYGCFTGGAGKEKAKSNAEGNGGVTGCAWDVPIDLAAFWVQVKRLCKDDHTPVLMFCTTKFGNELINSNPTWFRYDLVWNKMRGISFLMVNKMPMRSHEMIYVFAKKGANYTRVDVDTDHPEVERNAASSLPIAHHTYNGGKSMPRLNKVYPAGKRCPVSIIEASTKKPTGNHPTQKPDALYEWLIARYSKEGDTILDPTAGSFASCFTAQRLGRNAIGMEKDEGFYNKANAVVK
jgi:site-specific DNA-methyltransferase (adenine-specific)